MSAGKPRPSVARSLRALGSRERIAAIADPGTVAPVDAWLEAPRPSPHLARWGIAAQDDDGVAVARAAIRGAPVMIVAQDERFLRGSAGAKHGEALRRVFECARVERPAAVVVLAASSGVRLHEANPAELSLARALAALLDLRASGVAVLTVCIADTFGGASILAAAAERTALLAGVRFGLSGPAVIETARGRGEVDANDAAGVAALFGAESRAAAGHLELVADDAGAVRDWIDAGIRESTPFAASVHRMQARLAARFDVAEGVANHAPRRESGAPERLPDRAAPLYADAEPVDSARWLWRMSDRPLWISRANGAATLGPRDAHGLADALLAHIAVGSAIEPSTLLIVGDSQGHEASRGAESLCISQFLAQVAAVIALLRSQGVEVHGILTGIGHSAAFFATTLQAPHVDALASSRVVAMEPAAIARVLRRPESEIAALVETDAVIGQPVRHFASWGGIARILPDVDVESVRAIAGRPMPRR
ncbi:MAG: biotin-independent malonate decarboxylase subunit gamma [Betaproteobacteria bacterium]